MQVIKIYPHGFGCNSYIVTADGKSAVIVDCAEEGVYDECVKRGLDPAAVLLTHGHFDHVGGCGVFYAKGVPVYCGEKEADYIFSAENKGIFGGVYIPDFKIYKTLSDGECIEVAGINFKVIHTPGHTAGGVCYLADNCLFTGDTLFCGSVGRCDLPTGSASELNKSVKKLLALESNLNLYCGHGEDTTSAYEKRYNPYA